MAVPLIAHSTEQTLGGTRRIHLLNGDDERAVGKRGNSTFALRTAQGRQDCFRKFGCIEGDLHQVFLAEPILHRGLKKDGTLHYKINLSTRPTPMDFAP